MVATADSAAGSIRSGRLIFAVPHYKRCAKRMVHHYKTLVGADIYREVAPVIVGKNSALEVGIVGSLKRFLYHPEVNVLFGHKTLDEIFLRYVRSLTQAIPRKIGPAQQDVAPKFNRPGG